jgi:hypothetical protein
MYREALTREGAVEYYHAACWGDRPFFLPQLGCGHGFVAKGTFRLDATLLDEAAEIRSAIALLQGRGEGGISKCCRKSFTRLRTVQDLTQALDLHVNNHLLLSDAGRGIRSSL